MIKILIALLGFSGCCFALAFEDVDVHGETNYSSSKSQTMTTNLKLDYKIKLYEPDHKKYMFYLGGTINPDYDHFGNTVRVNSFTNFGFEF